MAVFAAGVGALVQLTAFGGGAAPESARAGAHVAAERAIATRTYHDPQRRFDVSYPSTWQQLASSDPQVALVLRAGPHSQDSVLVRVLHLAQAVPLSDLMKTRQVTDALIGRSKVHVLVSQPITLNGVSGLYYLYTFGTPGRADFGIHAHYFLFTGPRSLQVLVCQALPDTDFIRLAPVFDSIAQSYHAYG